MHYCFFLFLFTWFIFRFGASHIVFIQCGNGQCILHFLSWFTMIVHCRSLSSFFIFVCFLHHVTHCISRLNNNDNVFLRIMAAVHIALGWVELNCLVLENHGVPSWEYMEQKRSFCKIFHENFFYSYKNNITIHNISLLHFKHNLWCRSLLQNKMQCNFFIGEYSLLYCNA